MEIFNTEYNTEYKMSLLIKDQDTIIEASLFAVRKDPEAIRNIEYKTKEICEAVVKNPFVGAGAYLPEEYKHKLDKFYEERGYKTFGPIKVSMKGCRQTDPCKYHVILEDGTATLEFSTNIKERLKKYGIPFPR